MWSKSSTRVDLFDVLVLAGVSLTAWAHNLEFLDGALVRNTSPQKQLATDPSIGSRISLPSVGAFGRLIDPKAKTLLVQGGNCSSCSMNNFDPSKLRSTPEFRQVLILMTSNEADLPGFYRSLPMGYVVVPDPAHQLTIRLNASWLSRAYVIEGGKLSWVSARPGQWPNGVRYEAVASE